MLDELASLLRRLQVLDSLGLLGFRGGRVSGQLPEADAPELELGVFRLDVRTELGDVRLERLDARAQRLDLLGVTRGGFNLGGEISLDLLGPQLGFEPLRVCVAGHSLELCELGFLLDNLLLERVEIDPERANLVRGGRVSLRLRLGGGEVLLDSLELLPGLLEKRFELLDVCVCSLSLGVGSLGAGDRPVASKLHRLDALERLVPNPFGVGERSLERIDPVLGGDEFALLLGDCLESRLVLGLPLGAGDERLHVIELCFDPGDVRPHRDELGILGGEFFGATRGGLARFVLVEPEPGHQIFPLEALLGGFRGGKLRLERLDPSLGLEQVAFLSFQRDESVVELGLALRSRDESLEVRNLAGLLVHLSLGVCDLFGELLDDSDERQLLAIRVARAHERSLELLFLSPQRLFNLPDPRLGGFCGAAGLRLDHSRVVH